MAVYDQHQLRSYPASGDLSAHQYKAVVLNSSGQVALAGAAAAKVMILQNAPDAAGKPAACAYAGRVKAMAGGASVAIGALLATNGSGLLVTATTGQSVVGQAREASAASGTIISVELGYGGVAP